MRVVFFLSLALLTVATRVAVQDISAEYGGVEADLDAVVDEPAPESLVETGESTETASRRRAAPSRPAPRPAPPPAGGGGARRRGGPAPRPAPSADARRRGGAPTPRPTPTAGARRRGTVTPPAPVTGARRRGTPAQVDSRRRAAPAPAAPQRRRRSPVADIRRRDNSRRRMNYNDQVTDHTRRRSDMRRRSSDGWLEGGHRRRGVYPTSLELGGLGFAAGIAIGYSVTGAGGHHYYYHNVGWSDSYGVYHAPGYYSPDGYYWASGNDIGYSTTFGRWGSITPEVNTLFNLVDLNNDGVVSRNEFRYGLEREFLQVGPGANMYLHR